MIKFTGNLRLDFEKATAEITKLKDRILGYQEQIASLQASARIFSLGSRLFGDRIIVGSRLINTGLSGFLVNIGKIVSSLVAQGAVLIDSGASSIISTIREVSRITESHL